MGITGRDLLSTVQVTEIPIYQGEKLTQRLMLSTLSYNFSHSGGAQVEHIPAGQAPFCSKQGRPRRRVDLTQ